jgi:hypothetical protein
MTPVKTGIKASYLGHPGKALGNRFDRRQIVGLMKGR